MNLIIISLTIIGALVVVYSVVYALVDIHSSTLWERILSILLLLGGCLGFVALIMLLIGIPFS